MLKKFWQKVKSVSKTTGAIAWGTLTEPGLIFGISGWLLFRANGSEGVIAYQAAVVLTTVITVTQKIQALAAKKRPPEEKSPQEEPKGWRKILQDPCAPLFIRSLALMSLTVATLATGLMNNAVNAAVYPCLISTFYAVSNFRNMADIRARIRLEEEKNPPAPQKPTPMQMAKMFLLRAELYVALAVITVGLSIPNTSPAFLAAGVGVPAVFSLSAILTSLKNIIKGNPPYTGHANARWAAMFGILGTALALTGNGMVAGSALCAGFAYARIEALTTPGGFRRVWQDIKSSTLKFFGKTLPPLAVPDDACVSASLLPRSQQLTKKFPGIGQGQKKEKNSPDKIHPVLQSPNEKDPRHRNQL